MINLENYRKGLIKGYQLAYQEESWYEKNKNNFCNSLKEKYPELVPEYARNSSVKNFLAFNPDDLIRFGYLQQTELKNQKFWTVQMLAGFSLYHSSRALGLSHTDFPLIGFKNKKSEEENYTNVTTICPTTKSVGKENVCTYVSYYSTPYLTKEYLRRDKGYGGEAIKYAYGISPFGKDKNNKLYNDRLRYKADIQDTTLRVTEQTQGVSAYLLKEDTNLLILGLDEVLINRPNLGKQNMKNFYQIMLDMKQEIMRAFGISQDVYDYFLGLIVTVGGIGTLQDNLNIIQRDYPQARGFEEGLKRWLRRNERIYKDMPLFSAGDIRVFDPSVPLSELPGVRFSTFEHDRPVMNVLSWLFKNEKTEVKSSEYPSRQAIKGFISSSLYVYSKGNGEITSETFRIKDLEFYTSRGYFHSEVGMFFAPEILERDRDNKYDLEYGINYLGIVQEYRKFKTTNTFHQGHLLEHNTWVGLVASSLYRKYERYGSTEFGQDLYLLAGFLHDLGKSGACDKKAVYKNLNVQDAAMSICNHVKDEKGDRVGFSYHTLPAHPSDGYEFLKGYSEYERFGLNEGVNGEKDKIKFEDWEKFFDKMGVNDFERRLVRIAVSSHWFFGDYLRHFMAGDKSYVEKYLRKVELFYNDEFFKLDKEGFKKVLIFTIIISISDIYGSEYDPLRNMPDEDRDVIINYLPNISLDEIDTQGLRTKNAVVSRIIEQSLERNRRDSFKREIIKNLEEGSERFLNAILEEVENFEFKPNNNYSTLFNLQKSYVRPADIYVAYPNIFPKVICFDLDQTLLSTKFNRDGTVDYTIYPDTYKVIEECQKLREKGIKICITSRHYAPKALRKLIFNDGILNYKNFDFIVSKYTGSIEKLENDLRNYPNFFEINGSVGDGFMLDYKGETYNIPIRSKFLDKEKISKHGHFNLVKRKFKVEYEEILVFDDDPRYFTSEGLGDASVFVAGVLTGDKMESQGIRVSLFQDAIAFFVFRKLI
jgi:hypothetical protein